MAGRSSAGEEGEAVTECLGMAAVGLIQATLVVMFVYPFVLMFQRDEERERAFWREHEEWMRDHRAKMAEIRGAQAMARRESP